MRPARAAVVALLLACAPVSANVGPPPGVRGNSMSEVGGVREVAIERETLRFDLRPLAHGEPAEVRAVYRLNNPGAARSLDLMFVGGSEVAGVLDIRLDGQSVPNKPELVKDVPPEWRPAPPYRGYGKSGGGWDDVSGWSFRLELPAGRHELAVSYRAKAAYKHGSDPTRRWGLFYVLAPARSWKSFGGLDLEVNCPPGWALSCGTSIDRDGDTFRGSFDELPADTLLLETNMPTPAAHGWVRLAGQGLFFAALSLGVLVPAVVGYRAGRGGRAWRWILLVSLAVGLGWTAVTVGGGLLWWAGPDWTIPASQRQMPYGYGDAFVVIGLIALAFALLTTGTAVMCAAAGVGRAGSRPRHPRLDD